MRTLYRFIANVASFVGLWELALRSKIPPEILVVFGYILGSFVYAVLLPIREEE